MEKEVFAELVISEFSDSHIEFTKAIGIPSTEAYNIGDEVWYKNKSKKFIAKKSRWKFDSPLNDTHSINDHIKYIVELIKPRKSLFLKLCNRANIKLNIIINTGGISGDYYEIEPDVMQELGQMKILLTFNIYIISRLAN